MIDAVPALPGSYALHLVLTGGCAIQVGRLGEIMFFPGDYIYMGSACGPGGLRARLAHHMRVASKPHWHIDYLRQSARLSTIWYSTDLARLECSWSQALLALPGASPAAQGFGASDCRSGCAAHLVRLPAGYDLVELEQRLFSPAEVFKME